MSLHLNIRITGKVQGVWFRDSTRRKAMELGVTGFARNEPDGSVYMEAEGTDDALNKLVEWCHQGPERARVDSVETEEGSIKNFEIFQIR